jgi:cystathionine beta-synthase
LRGKAIIIGRWYWIGMAGKPMAICEDVLELIGNTPMVRVRAFDTGACTLLLKLESQNPGGSIKDRIGRSMIEAAEKEGKIGPGSTLVEATAGNTGLGLALVAASKGYRLTLVIPDKMSQEKLLHLRALGVTIVMTRSDVGKGHPQYYQDLAERIARVTPGAFYVNQFNNPANPRAHEMTTGPEIWRQTEGKVDAVVCGVGSGGTITGLSRFFAATAPNVEMVLADPVGSVLAEYVRTKKIGTAGSWLVEGIGEDFIPGIADLSRVKKAYSIPDAEAFEVIRTLLKREAIFAGSSTGTLMAAALRYCREQKKGKTVVTFVCDTGSKYLSKAFNDFWLADQGLSGRQAHGDLRDMISRPFREGAVVAVGPDDPLAVTYARMRLYDFSQLAVMDGENLVGIVDEGDLLLAVREGGEAFERPVREVMTANVRTIDHRAGLGELMAILDTGLVAVVSDEEGFHGMITRIDVLNFLRKEQMRK